MNAFSLDANKKNKKENRKLCGSTKAKRI